VCGHYQAELERRTHNQSFKRNPAATGAHPLAPPPRHSRFGPSRATPGSSAPEGP
jgi:hypothetical protein